ncbi:hypothetical protein [Leptolyngbya sp. NIES-2104]|uniref:hypothetical protein n=1 Tax=Leptolyngbya sp. NIES-2104 TaxID=1552121 RepID=UPI0006EC549B|nr:hypothetical protein [Leptolyngbya sp. NIES-2104]GAP97410.1 hypothetical protein NIES2104_39570 [Leptolyngbya sp. NIES-2104]
MAFFRQYIAPLIVVLVFVFSLVVVSARIFLPNDMAAPAPIEEANPTSDKAQTPDDAAVAGLPPSLAPFIQGLPNDPAQL